jgi:hypothetical protein
MKDIKPKIQGTQENPKQDKFKRKKYLHISEANFKMTKTLCVPHDGRYNWWIITSINTCAINKISRKS